MIVYLIRLLYPYAQVFSIVVDVLGTIWFMSRVLLKYLPAAKTGTKYATFRRALGHFALVIGEIDEHV